MLVLFKNYMLDLQH